MVEEVRTVQTVEPPAWMRRFMVSEGATPGILDEAARLYLQGRNAGLPQYQIAARTPFQQEAARLASTGIWAYFQMLQAGSLIVG